MLGIEMDLHSGGESHGNLEQGPGLTSDDTPDQAAASENDSIEEDFQHSPTTDAASDGVSSISREDSFEDIYKRRRTASCDELTTGSFGDYSWNDARRPPERSISRDPELCHPQTTSNQQIPLPGPRVDRLLFHRKYLSELGQRWVTVEPVVMVSSLVYYTLLPTLQRYVHWRLEQDHNMTSSVHANHSQHELCTKRGVGGVGQSSAAEHALQHDLYIWNTVIILSIHLPIIIVIIAIGVWSDALGRRMAMLPQILAQIIGSAFSTICVALELPLWVLPVILVVTGLTGSVTSVSMAAYAYIADINPPARRLLRLAIIEIGVGIAAMVSGLIINLMIDHWGFIVPNIISTGIMALLFFYVFLFVPETILSDRNAPIIPCSYLSDIPKLWIKGGGAIGTLPIIWLCLAIMFFNSMISRSGLIMILRYIVEPPLCWSNLMRCLYIGLSYALKALACAVFVKVFERYLRLPYFQLIGALSMCLKNICLGFAETTVLPFVGCVLGSAAMLVSPVTRAVASAVVSDKQQGALFAGLGFAQTLADLIGFPIAENLYADIPVRDHRFIFLGMAGSCVVPVALIITLLYISRHQDTRQDINIGGSSTADTDELVIN